MLRDTSGALAVVKARLAALAPRRGPFVDNVRNGVQDVVLVASSSRGGSSMFSETLRHSGELLHFQAEVNPFFLLAGLGPGVGGRTSDALPADAAFDADVLDRELALDMGNRQIGTVDLGAWAAEVAWRLQAQWPTLELDPDVVERCALDAVEANENGHWNSLCATLSRRAMGLQERYTKHVGSHSSFPYRLVQCHSAASHSTEVKSKVVVE